MSSFGGRESKEYKRGAFLAACDRHVEVARDAKAGQGVDRIFLALEKEAERTGVNVDLFGSDVYRYSKVRDMVLGHGATDL